MRSIPVLLLVTLWIGCAPADRGKPEDAPPVPDACVGLRCRVTDCAKAGRTQTTISGTVFAPNGTLPLYGVTVYVPNGDPGFLTDGAQCSRCTKEVPGDPIVKTTTDPAGKFVLADVPSGVDVPLVITIGKWRRQIRIPVVAECADTALPAAQTSLPKKKSEGEMPKIAMVTGGCDALECLVRKLGVDDSEFTNDDGDGRVHLFASNGGTSTATGQVFAPASTLWGSVNKMKQYDLAMFSCECGQRANEKPQAMMDAVKAYANFGGRVFMSHFHAVWISGESNNPSHAPAVWPTIASCSGPTASGGTTGVIDRINNPSGPAFATWMNNVMGANTAGEFAISSAMGSCSTLNKDKADLWVHTTNDVILNFQFTTPNEVLEEKERCGKVVFSDMHVSSGSSSLFPNGCSATAMTSQEKALAYMFFDIANCVGPVIN
jgi:hypothetical protein